MGSSIQQYSNNVYKKVNIFNKECGMLFFFFITYNLINTAIQNVQSAAAYVKEYQLQRSQSGAGLIASTNPRVSL